MVCGTGVGAAIAATKCAHSRRRLARLDCAHQAVEHDDVNVMCLGAQIVACGCQDLIDAYLSARFP